MTIFFFTYKTTIKTVISFLSYILTSSYVVSSGADPGRGQINKPEFTWVWLFFNSTIDNILKINPIFPLFCDTTDTTRTTLKTHKINGGKNRKNCPSLFSFLLWVLFLSDPKKKNVRVKSFSSHGFLQKHLMPASKNVRKLSHISPPPRWAFANFWPRYWQTHKGADCQFTMLSIHTG